MENRNTRGSEWHKWDLHIHTTSSYDYEDKTITDEEFIKNLADKNVSAIAITDHHFIDIDKINKLREIGTSYNISVFPGIEFLSDARGKDPIHFIGIFSDKANITYIWSQIQAKTNISRIQGERKKINEVYCDLADTTQLIHELGGVVSIHAGKKSNSLENITHALPHGDAQKNDIARIVDIFEVGLEKDVKEYKEKVIPCIEREIGKKHPIILCSDNHNIKNYTVKQSCWIKSDLTFDGLKQIIYEPEDRIYIGADKPEQKNDYQIIDSISFDNKEMGNQVIFFNQNLNTIIGGRSSGKSILLGSIAKLVDKTFEPKKGNENYNTLIASINKKSVIKWRDNTTKPRKAIYFSQSEISDIVRPDEYGISGINDLVQNIIKKDENKLQLIQKYETSMTANRTEINTKINDYCELSNQISEKMEAIANIGNKSGIVSEIEKIKNEIDSIKKGIEGYLSEEEDKEYKKIKDKITKAKNIENFINSDLNQLEISKNVELFTSIETVLSGFSSHSHEKIVEFYERIKQETKGKWMTFIENQINIFNEEKVNNNNKINEYFESDLYKKGTSFQTNNELLAIKEQALQIEKRKKSDIEKYEQEIRELTNSRKICISTIWELFKKYENMSNELALQLSMSKDEVEITTKNNFLYKDFFNKALDALNKREKVSKKYDSFEEKSPDERSKFIEEIFDGIVNGKLPLKKDLHQTLIDLYSNCYYKLSYEVTFENDSFEKMSEGKKAFIVLRLLLDFDDSKCPIIIDQPEDDLDNRAIYDKLVSYLRKKKKNRQIILATHNPNVVVGADAELVIVANQYGLHNKNQDGIKFEYYANSIENSFIDDKCETTLLSKGIREHICEILEGGNTAFEIREKKYGYKQ